MRVWRIRWANGDQAIYVQAENLLITTKPHLSVRIVEEVAALRNTASVETVDIPEALVIAGYSAADALREFEKLGADEINRVLGMQPAGVS